MSITAWAATLGLVLSVAVAVLTYFFVKEQEKANAFVVGFASLGLAATIAAFAEIYEVKTQQVELIERARAEQAELLGRVVPTIVSPRWAAIVRDIAEYDKQLVSIPTRNPFEESVHEPLRRAILQTLQQAREGNIVLRTLPETVDLATTLMEQATRSIRATSYVRPSEWWDTPEGKTYASRSAAVRKGKVKTFERVFIVASDDDVQAMIRLGRDQEKDGTEVRFVCAATIPPDERSDFIVIDSTVGGELTLDANRRFERAHFYPTETRAKDLEQKFRLLWLRARRLNEGFKGC